MRIDADRDLVLLRPLSPGLKELIRRRVFLSPSCEPSDEVDWIEAERFLRLPRALLSRVLRVSSFLCGGDLDREGERLVEMVETESAEETDKERVRLRSCAFFFRISSATPFLRRSSFGTSVVSLG